MTPASPNKIIATPTARIRIICSGRPNGGTGSEEDLGRVVAASRCIGRNEPGLKANPELVRLHEKPVAKIAEDLGIFDSCLRGWMAQARVDDGQRPALGTDERAELVRLRCEKRVLEIEVEILMRGRVTEFAGSVVAR
jgi:hypothetical protein